MATKKEIDEQLKIALDEIGKITPWFDREVREWVFSHKLYPVEYAGETKKEVIENYPKYLREFICHRLNQKLEKKVAAKTKGRGGKRAGAGRPKGSTKSSPTTTIRVDASLATWIKAHQDEIRAIMMGTKSIISTKRR